MPPRSKAAKLSEPTKKREFGAQSSFGFPPIARGDARVLILGSLPGAVSLARQQYYAQPQNSFWPILGSLLGFDPHLPYAQRAEQLRIHRIALWDVCRSGIRPGSLDSAIRRSSVTANGFEAFFRAHPSLRAIAFNGRTAEHLFRSLVLPTLPASTAELCFLPLPSTSPAYASLRSADKLAHWRTLLDWLEPSAPAPRHRPASRSLRQHIGKDKSVPLDHLTVANRNR